MEFILTNWETVRFSRRILLLGISELVIVVAIETEIA
jgi:hypothetical protein